MEIFFYYTWASGAIVIVAQLRVMTCIFVDKKSLHSQGDKESSAVLMESAICLFVLEKKLLVQLQKCGV